MVKSTQIINLSKRFIKYFNINDINKNNMLISAYILKNELDHFKLEIL